MPTEEGPLDLVADAAGGELEVVHHLLALLVQGQEGAVRVLLLADGPGRFEFLFELPVVNYFFFAGFHLMPKSENRSPPISSHSVPGREHFSIWILNFFKK